MGRGTLKCFECGAKADVREDTTLLCSSCWFNWYAGLNRKETQRYGTRFSNAHYPRGKYRIGVNNEKRY